MTLEDTKNKYCFYGIVSEFILCFLVVILKVFHLHVHSLGAFVNHLNVFFNSSTFLLLVVVIEHYFLSSTDDAILALKIFLILN